MKMDTSIEGFFNKREFNLDNFNLLLYALNEKNDIDSTFKVIKKMELLEIELDPKSYSIIIMTAARKGDVKLAEEFFDTAVKSKFEYPSKMFYSNRNCSHCEKN